MNDQVKVLMESDEREACPYANSDMTPCVMKDGEMCVVLTSVGQRVCVGCGRDADNILAEGGER